MYKTNDILLLDVHPKSATFGSHSVSLTFEQNIFNSSDLFYNDENSLSSVSPLPFDIPDDFNEYNEALFTQLIDEFNQDPLIDLNEFDDFNDELFIDHLDNLPNLNEAQIPSNDKKRKQIIRECDIETEINPKRSKKDLEKQSNNNDAAYRYRQKQKINKTKLEEDLNKSAFEMVNAKNDMLEMRKKLNTVKNIVKDLLKDKGFIN